VENGRNDVPCLGQDGRNAYEILTSLGKNWELSQMEMGERMKTILFIEDPESHRFLLAVKILDQCENTILTTVSNGPWLFLNL
jgi:hypothetical protein